MIKQKKGKKRYLAVTVCLCAAGILINLIMTLLGNAAGFPFLLSNLGTVLVSVAGGLIPGVISGFISSAIRGIQTPLQLYYGVINALVAVLAVRLLKNGFKGKKRIYGIVAAILAFTAVESVVGTLLVWFVNGFRPGNDIISSYAIAIAEKTMLGQFVSLFAASLIVSLINYTLTVLLALLICSFVPQSLRDKWNAVLNPVSSVPADKSSRCSLLKKVVVAVLAVELLLGTVACTITYFLYKNVAIEKYREICSGVTDSAALAINPEKVDDYIKRGRSAEGYDETESMLYGIKESFPQIEYIYSYRIEPDGCRVVFDLDSGDTEASEVGSIVEFDESFSEYLPTLFAGGEIEPIISNDTYGWLLTVYKPLRDSQGNCVCYVAADIMMDSIIADEAMFVIKMMALFFGVSIVIICIVLELVKQRIIFPINAMANAAADFAYDTDEGRTSSLSRLKSLHITSGDEIQNLYMSISKMAEDSASYIDEVKKQSALITKMQEDIIIDFAEMVEARDKCTGDHIKKTSLYVDAIAKELRREGKYPDILTEEYASKLVRSAPLHDVGKIKISDLILNKPARLTDEEFELMKTHTTEGKTILSRTYSMNETSGYLKEAIEMATYHHERWDGTGYPCGAKGDEIPLSARIMAVADVFDALVSQRSYKKPFTFDEAINIIKEESGTHFDPVVAEAFLNIASEVYEKGQAE